MISSTTTKKSMRDCTWSVLLAKEAGIDQLQTQHRRAKGNDEKVQGKNELTVAEQPDKRPAHDQPRSMRSQESSRSTARVKDGLLVWL